MTGNFSIVVRKLKLQNSDVEVLKMVKKYSFLNMKVKSWHPRTKMKCGLFIPNLGNLRAHRVKGSTKIYVFFVNNNFKLHLKFCFRQKMSFFPSLFNVNTPNGATLKHLREKK